MKWHKGPPPDIGWWPASGNVIPDPKCIRWWNGKCWSVGAYSKDTAEHAAKVAKYESMFPDQIQWTDRWWL